MELKDKIPTINELPKEIIRKVRIGIGEIKRSLVRLKATEKDVVANNLKSDVFREYVRGGKGLKIEDCLLTIRTIEKHIEQGFISGTGARTWKSQDFYSFYFEDDVAKWKALVAEFKKGKQSEDAYTIPKGHTSDSLREKHQNYLKQLEKEFSFIRLGVVDFKMHIKHFIKLPLLKSDSILQEQLTRLEEKKEAFLKNESADKKQLESINNKIRDIKRILEKEHDILDVIHLGNNVFIEAPAGYGKSTLLRWLTYTFALESKTFFPVFVELMYNTSNNLVSIIEEQLTDYDLTPDIVKDKKLLLLLDGFDQFTGNKTDLFKDLKRLRRKYPVHIIFSGRKAEDLSKHQFDLVVYNLKPFQKADIKNIMLAYFEDQSKGLHYYDYVTSRQLTEHLSRPLYLAFFVAFIEKQIGYGIADDSDIATYIVNKGKLLESLIVDGFIKKYEKDDHTSEAQWKHQKTLQIELLGYLAHHMSYTLKGIEVMKLERVKALLEERCKSNKHYAQQIPTDAIKDFLKHNILYRKNKLISFEKKELRLFFTALHIRKQVKSTSDFFKIKREVIKQTDDYTWESISYYLIGFINPDILLANFKEIDYDAPLLLHHNLFDQYKLALECIHQSNYPVRYNYINEDYLFKLNLFFIEELLRTKQDTATDYYISIKPLFRDTLIALGLSNNKKLPKSVAHNLNRRFFKFASNGNFYQHRIDHYIRYFKKYDFKKPFDQILEIINPLDETIFEDKKYFFMDLLQKDNHFPALSTRDKVAIVYSYIFERDDPKYKQLFYHGSHRVANFCAEVIHKHSSEFVNYFFDKKQDILPFTFKRYLIYTKQHWKARWQFDSKKITPEYLNKLTVFLKPKFINTEINSRDFHRLSYLFFISFDDAFRVPFLDFFNDVMQSNEYNQAQKVRAVTYLIHGQRKSDLNYLGLMVVVPKNPIRELIRTSLELYFPNSSRAKYRTFNQGYLEFIIDVIENGELSTDSKANIMFNLAYTNDKLNSIAIQLLKKNEKEDYLVRSLISFLGHFKVTDAVTALEPFLQNDQLKSLTYYILYQINYSHHFTYASEVRNVYENMMAFLEAVSSRKVETITKKNLFEALYLGDRKTLSLLEKIQDGLQHLTLEDVSEGFFLTTLNRLTTKCNILNKQNPS